ncbi:MAG: FKBP-type peptidyl-prolyl cis-trans isomerase, partial [Alistipes sp.]|nr:FKBP-type peptidyl-prolyl cis-trans isomerase [Alistipes sp.]
MISRQQITTIFATVAMFVAMACGRTATSSGNGTISNQSDSLSYVVGMNIAYNIMQMDSTLNPAAVVRGINDALNSEEMLSLDEARTYFLAYMNFDIYERVKNYEEQYLTDLAKSDKDIVRTQSGLTYKVAELGNMNKVAMRDRDSVAISYRATRLSGEEVDPVGERDEIVRESVGKLIAGLKEGVKLVGEGGKVTLWIPSALAYGSAGAEKKG